MSIWATLEADIATGLTQALDVIVTTLAAIEEKPPAPGESQTDSLAGLILAQNHALAFADGVLSNPTKGTTIHSIAEADAADVARALVAVGTQIPLAYGAACLDIESVFDPLCINENKGPGESNPTGAEDGWDVGVAQLKLRYLIGVDGIATVGDAYEFATNPAKAIGYFADLMADHLTQADALITALPASVTNPVWKNRYAVATTLYNFGATGGKAMVLANDPTPTHVTHVTDLEAVFAKALGTKPVMP